MENKITLAGLDFVINFCNKINTQPIPLAEIPQQSLANIYANPKGERHYIVNIISFLPLKLDPVKNASSGLFLNEEKTIFFNYNGVTDIKTSIHTESGLVVSRDFNIVYDSTDPIPSEFNMYHIQIDYKIASLRTQSVEAIVVHDKNLDPETDRGTVTTPVTSGQ
ncbi:hypothetical protein [Aquimarina macrocephali]|uniref:hypothetical protein n=1 Tax=Aquimarina macrocephali TaxID=666563 RepID=UPI003F661F10